MFGPNRVLNTSDYYGTTLDPDDPGYLAAIQFAHDFAHDYFLALLAEAPAFQAEPVQVPIAPGSSFYEPAPGPFQRPEDYARERFNNIERFIEDQGTMIVHVDPSFAPEEAEKLQGLQRGVGRATTTHVEFRWAQVGLPTDQWSTDGTSESRLFNFPPQQ